ncbi:MAG: uncharacterized protein E1N59_2740 [Puniceicoccaceae bacterium 5H]|nr:MAG: uncharacterized protein E1N59_2740 [Puniceicoccaceae bacterium 5H]
MLLLAQTSLATHLALFIGGAVLAVVIGYWWVIRWIRSAKEQLEEQRKMGERENELQLRDLKAQQDLEWEKKRMQLESEWQQRLREAEHQERVAGQHREELEDQQRRLQEEKQEQEDARQKLREQREQLNKEQQELQGRLESMTHFDRDAAREALMEEVRRDCDLEVRELRSEMLGKAEKEIQHDARRVLLTAMQRLASTAQHDVTATIVSLPTEDMKGRIIGREGRNIKSFESMTGTTLLIDETPNSVLISSFDPVRREVARIALEALVRDGRIHPSSIEDAVAEAETEVKQSVIEYGEEALRRLRLGRLHPEVVTCLGRLHYRLSNNQNTLDHSIEVANLCALMAAELGLDIDLAKRAGLLHDIGKVLDEQYEGSHAVAGANFLKRYGEEDDRVINAVAAHHHEISPTSAYSPLVVVADSLSAMRPGARADSFDGYIQRVRNLEKIARSFEGVTDAYAIQAGREIRVIVSPEKIDDASSRRIAREVRRRIEDELQYPGTIKVTVIRESRITETAK